jgi:hypothetical protein
MHFAIFSCHNRRQAFTTKQAKESSCAAATNTKTYSTPRQAASTGRADAAHDSNLRQQEHHTAPVLELWVANSVSRRMYLPLPACHLVAVLPSRRPTFSTNDNQQSPAKAHNRLSPLNSDDVCLRPSMLPPAQHWLASPVSILRLLVVFRLMLLYPLQALGAALQLTAHGLLDLRSQIQSASHRQRVNRMPD